MAAEMIAQTPSRMVFGSERANGGFIRLRLAAPKGNQFDPIAHPCIDQEAAFSRLLVAQTEFASGKRIARLLR